MLFRVKHLFTTVSVQLTFFVLLFSIFMVVFFNASSMVCMAHMTRWLAFYTHSLGFEPVEQASRGKVLSSETFFGGLCRWGFTFGIFY